MYPSERYIHSRQDNWSQLVERYAHETAAPVSKSRTRIQYVQQLFKAVHGFDMENAGRILSCTKLVREKCAYRYPLMLLHHKVQKYEAALREEAEWRGIDAFHLRCLDAPRLIDDFYLSLLDAPLQPDMPFVIALNQKAYTYHMRLSTITEVCNLENEPERDQYISSVRWLNNPAHLFMGLSSSSWRILDVVKSTRLASNTLGQEFGRINCVEPFGQSGAFIGCQNGAIAQLDGRQPNAQATIVGKHAIGQHVCGLRLHDNNTYLASGGNDNVVNIWDIRRPDVAKLCITEHLAAVKALCWSPTNSDLLLSGGGKSDRSIKVTSLNRMGVIASEAGGNSPISGIHFSDDGRRVATCHGLSNNSVIVWKFDGHFTKLVELAGHSSRILFSSLLADRTTLVTASADETLRSWNVFAASTVAKKRNQAKGDTVAALELSQQFVGNDIR